jgi:SAM-dependent methyltransferase
MTGHGIDQVVTGQPTGDNAANTTALTEAVHEAVRERYANAALTVLNGEGCCANGEGFGPELYSALEREELPNAAVLASLGCGNPVMVADLHPGERVLDLGSGGGIDVLLSARRVGSTGRAFGLDMTDEMLALAQRNAAEAGIANVEWLRGHIEAIPLPASSIDVVISNCVVNLAADKPAVFREIARVLKPGGRIGISDVVANDELSPEQRAALGDYAGCVAGALTFSEYRIGLLAAGLDQIEMVVTNAGANGLNNAIVRAVKPAGQAQNPNCAEAGMPARGRGCCG